MEPVTVRRKGQVTLPAELRKDLDLHEGDIIYFQRRGNETVLLRKADIVDPTAGALAKYATNQSQTGIDDMGLAVEEGVLESWNRFVRETEAEYDK